MTTQTEPREERPLEAERPTPDPDRYPTDDQVSETARARRAALSAIMLLLLLLLILLLIAAATERTDIINFAGMVLPLRNGARDFQARVGAAPVTQAAARPPEAAAVDPRFAAHYARFGGEQIFGRPISPALASDDGRVVQWFERARLEHHPEHAGTPYEVLGGRVGAEFTRGVSFPQPTPFADQPGARFFPLTGHGVTEPFLSFWERSGGVTVLGYPISEQVQEVLPDGAVYTVQYFERARIERHPEHAGTPDELQLGMLGRALYDGEAPQLIPPAPPTPLAQG